MGAGAIIAAPYIVRGKGLLASANLSKIAIIKDSRASTYAGKADGTDAGVFTVNQGIINQMIDSAVIALTGAATVGLAWEALIRAKVSNLSTGTKIAIKFNQAYSCGTTDLATQSGYTTAQRCPYGARGETINAVVAGLREMLGGTFPVENIIAFDKMIESNAINTKMVSAGFPSDPRGISNAYDAGGANGQFRAVMANPSTYSSALTLTTPALGPNNKIITQKLLTPLTLCDVWIDVGIPKVNVGGAITGVLKNCYGCTDDCGTTHPNDGVAANTVIHDGVPAFYKQLIDGAAGRKAFPCAVNILDGIAGNYAREVFSGPSFIANTIAMSVDPVTVDFLSTELVNAARTANGWARIETPSYDTAGRFTFNGGRQITGQQFPGTVNVSPNHGSYYTNYVNFHLLAVAEYTGLGNMNAGDRVQVTSANDDLPSLDKPQGRMMSVVRSASGWRMGVQLDASGRQHRIESRILDALGREIRSFPTQTTRQRACTLDWDGRGFGGLAVPAGLYCWEVRIDDTAYSQRIN
jgi:hypothetical protein